MADEYLQTSMFTNLNNSSYTYKSSNLIESSYELSITEQRIISLGCKMIQPIYIEKRVKPSDLESVLGAMKFSKLKISVNEFKEEYNIKGNNVYSLLKEASDVLFKRAIEYYNEKGSLVKKRWVSTCEYNANEGYINLTFNPDMILDLLVFKGKYVALFFDMSQNIKSKYAFRLYEILKNYAYLGKYRVTIEELKFMLAINGAYSEYKEFNRNVIKPNLEVINKFSDITVDVKPIRKGRAVEELEFYLSIKNNKTFSPDNNFKEKIPNSYKEISDALKKYNVELSSGDAEMLFNSVIEYTKMSRKDVDAMSYMLEKIKVLDDYVETHDVKNVIGFLKWAIETDYKMESQPIEKTKKLKFDNFEGRDYDFDALEEMALGYAEYDVDKLYNK